MGAMSKHTTPKAAVDALEALYAEAVSALTDALGRFLRDGTPPDGEARAGGVFCYPQLRVVYDPEGPPPPISRSLASRMISVNMIRARWEPGQRWIPAPNER